MASEGPAEAPATMKRIAEDVSEHFIEATEALTAPTEQAREIERVPPAVDVLYRVAQDALQCLLLFRRNRFQVLLERDLLPTRTDDYRLDIVEKVVRIHSRVVGVAEAPAVRNDRLTVQLREQCPRLHRDDVGEELDGVGLELVLGVKHLRTKQRIERSFVELVVIEAGHQVLDGDFDDRLLGGVVLTDELRAIGHEALSVVIGFATQLPVLALLGIDLGLERGEIDSAGRGENTREHAHAGRGR